MTPAIHRDVVPVAQDQERRPLPKGPCEAAENVAGLPVVLGRGPFQPVRRLHVLPVAVAVDPPEHSHLRALQSAAVLTEVING